MSKRMAKPTRETKSTKERKVTKMFVRLKEIKVLKYNQDYLFREAFPELALIFFDKARIEIELEFKKWAIVEYKEIERKGCKQKLWTVRRIRKTFLEKMLDK